MHELVRSFVHTLGRADRLATLTYVLLSLGVALAGSFAALLLVPLVQPGRTLPFSLGLLDARHGVGMQATLFATATSGFALLRWRVTTLGARLVGRYGMFLRRTVHLHLMDAPLASIANATSAEVGNVLTYNIEIIVQGFSALQQLLVAGVTTAVSLGFAFWLSPPLMLAAPVLALFAMATSRIYGHEQSQVGRQYVADMTKLFWHSEDFPRRLRHVRSFERSDAEKACYGDISARLYQGYRRQLELVASGRLLLELLAGLGIAAVFVFAHHWHGVDQASLIAVCLLLGRLLPYLASTRQSFQQLRSATPAFELWRRYVNVRSSCPASCPTASSASAGTGKGIFIEQLQLKPPLAGLAVTNLALMPGEMTVICGDSGIGKSSLADVLAGMLPPAVFEARAGVDTIDFDQYLALVHRGAYVSQSVRPWQRSVRECLLWAAPGATDDLLYRVVGHVGLGERLAASSDGLDSALDDVSNRFSGGELQRLLLAQVILRRPSLAVLDEATSALDALSERTVLSTMRRLLPETILIVVSHRISLASMADQCLTIAGDRMTVVERKPDMACQVGRA